MFWGVRGRATCMCSCWSPGRARWPSMVAEAVVDLSASQSGRSLRASSIVWCLLRAGVSAGEARRVGQAWRGVARPRHHVTDAHGRAVRPQRLAVASGGRSSTTPCSGSSGATVATSCASGRCSSSSCSASGRTPAGGRQRCVCRPYLGCGRCTLRCAAMTLNNPDRTHDERRGSRCSCLRVARPAPGRQASEATHPQPSFDTLLLCEGCRWISPCLVIQACNKDSG